MTDTIYALASASGRGGVAVFRVSGPQAAAALAALAGFQSSNLPTPRTAVLRTLVNPVTAEKIDTGLVLWFPAPNSFTGEDVVEFQPHGGRAVTAAMLQALGQVPGLRLAAPGEFTKRAFLHGKLDLTEAEAIADLVDAETEQQRRQALRQLEGELGRLYHGWSQQILQMLAHLEAYLDFPDEALPEALAEQHQAIIKHLTGALQAHLADAHRGERLRDGIRIAIVGAPNAGKSSLLNALALRDAAIVSPTPGTTRDVVEVALNLGGFPVLLADTAGLRETTDSIEAEGVRRAGQQAENADIKIAVFDGTQPPDDATLHYVGPSTLVVLNKADLGHAAYASADSISVSTKTGAGLDDLRGAMLALLAEKFAVGPEPSLTRARHRTALKAAEAHLQRAASAPSLELAAEDLRLALREIGQITGKIDVEQILDVIFRDFCIGK